jgi:AraC-like DNA-binding protein
VNVLAFLGSSQLAQLLRALPPPHRITNVTDWHTVTSALSDGRGYDVAVLDPGAGGEHASADRLRTLADVAGPALVTPVVGYVAVTAAGIRTAYAFARLVPGDVSNIVVRGIDDAPAAFAATVHGVVSSAEAHRLVSSVEDPFGALPPTVARAIETLFHRPERLRSVSALAAEAKTTRRSLDRWLARAGLASARTLLACARANAAFRLLGAGHVRTSHAAAMLGYASPRALTRELRALTGCAPSAIPAHLTRSAFSAAIARQLRRPTRPARTQY